MESFEDRLKRFLANSPEGVFIWMLNSISNFTLDELRAATDAGLFRLAFLGAHAVEQTVGEYIYGMRGLEATRFYLEQFVDGDSADTKFSAIAEQLHSIRNVHAHRLSSRISHTIGWDTSMIEGWKREGDELHVNPIVFMKFFAAGFRQGSRMWTMPRELDKQKALCRKYTYLRCWLELAKGDELSVAIRTLEQSDNLDEMKSKAVKVHQLANFRFRLEQKPSAPPWIKDQQCEG